MLRLSTDNQPAKALARNMLEGQLFIQVGEELKPDNVKMAICRYSDDDNDVIYIHPFKRNQLSAGFDDLRNDYINEGTEVVHVSFVGELERD